MNNDNKGKEEYYKTLLSGMIGDMARILADGQAIEIDRSRSGLKLFYFRRRHYVLSTGKKEG